MYDIYVHDGISVRYVLGCTGKNNLIVFGINPSKATNEKADPTISRVNGYLKKYNFDGFKMLNLYPFRATNPNNLPQDFDLNIHTKNLAEIKYTLESGNAVLCAWGNLIFKRSYLIKCFNDISKLVIQSKVPTYCLGMTKAGNPLHPLARVAAPDKMKTFDINKYIEITERNGNILRS